jgi:hypothetical protein
MREPSGPPAPTIHGVVLLVPEALGDSPDPERLRKTLLASPRAARVLLYLTGNAGHELATMLADLGVDFQILLAGDAAELKTEALCVRAPRDMSREDQIEFALALCDWVFVASKSDQHPVARNALRLGMTLIVPGDPLPGFIPETFAHRLDPESPGWRIFRRINGRLEQAIVEMLAFAWSGWDRGGRAESWRRLRLCTAPGWGSTAYFAPRAWRDLSPDRAAIDPCAPMVATFEAMDRSATHGAYIHRDITWLTHFGAAFAVFAAVAGYVFPVNGVLWGVLEFVTLLAIALGVYRTRHSGLQDRWTACRFAAEQLRIARMSLPLLVLPPALATQDTRAPRHRDSDDKLEFVALAQVKRAVRDQGLPRLNNDFNSKHAAKWVQLIVSDQLAYHRRNERKLEHAEKRLGRVTKAIFAVAVIAVVAHLIEVLTHLGHHDWLLLFTAAGPALAAALHGAGTRMGIVHRAALSKAVERELEVIDDALKSFLEAPSDTREACSKMRRLAYEAANAMGRENTSWHGLVRRYRDELP